MTLDNLKFRKLENGYTIKYHVTKSDAPEEGKPSGFGGELYVTGVEQLKQACLMLIDKHCEPDDDIPF